MYDNTRAAGQTVIVAVLLQLREEPERLHIYPDMIHRGYFIRRYTKNNNSYYTNNNNYWEMSVPNINARDGWPYYTS